MLVLPQEDIVKIVIEIYDRDGDGSVSRDEFMDGWEKEGKRLPDFGVSPLESRELSSEQCKTETDRFMM